LLQKPPQQRAPGVLGLDCGELIEKLVPARDREEVRAWVETVDTGAAGEQAHGIGIGALCLHAEAYPQALAETGDPPPVLWVSGGLRCLEDALDAPAVTIVGTRRPSPYGREMAHTLGRDLASAGVTVVSGLALGIDAAAHRGALDGVGTPVAVVANGPDVPYPRTNSDLWRRITDRGVVVSELPPGARPYRWSFPARNRIMAAVAELTVVVEAADPSGSLITARFAGQLGRTIGAVPGRATSQVAAGTNELLRDGAAVIRGAEDVVAELAPASRELLTEPAPVPVEDPTAGLDPAAGRVLEAVETEQGIEAIGRRARLAAAEVRGALARLEGAGLVSRDPLGRYLRRAGG
jgi:DNA processing protein